MKSHQGSFLTDTHSLILPPLPYFWRIFSTLQPTPSKASFLQLLISSPQICMCSLWTVNSLDGTSYIANSALLSSVRVEDGMAGKRDLSVIISKVNSPTTKIFWTSTQPRPNCKIWGLCRPLSVLDFLVACIQRSWQILLTSIHHVVTCVLTIEPVLIQLN